MIRPVRSRLPDLLAWLVLALATLIVCYPLGLTNRILAGVDAFTYFTPYWAQRMEAFRAGQIPLWNPYLFSGVPFLANIQAAVLYPLHWPFSWLKPEQALVWSALLHVWLAAGFTYVLARRSLGVGRLAALLAGLIFGLGGFSLARIENINQLNALAWLPALIWLYDETVRGPRRALSFVGLTVVIALQLLAGHTQTTFINMIGLGLWAVFSMGWPLQPWSRLRRGLLRLFPLLATLPALALSAAQLLPTIELNTLGLRTGGLDYRTATSFSLRPQLLLQSFLPPYRGGLDAAFGSEGYAEFVAYIGITGLILAAAGAWAIWRAFRTKEAAPYPSLALALAGLFLAFGRYNPAYYVLWRIVPGFDLFRAPARWAELYALGGALLAAWGLERLGQGRLGNRVSVSPGSRLRILRVVAPLLLLIELIGASRALPFALATAPMATALRNAPAALLAATGDQPPAGRDRFLSLSNIRYDPGDLAELRALQADRLPAGAVERMVRAAKQVEVLAPNLPLFFHLPAVDGYDGGLLPLHRYVKLQELFLSPDHMTPDGRLAEQLPAIPDGRLLDLTGVRFVITDKQADLWAGDIYYDLEQSATIPPGATLDFDLAGYPPFPADAVGVVATFEGAPAGPSTVTLRASSGDATAEGAFEPGAALSQPPQPAIVSLSRPLTPARISLTNTSAAPLTLQGLSLIDTRTQTHTSITVSPRGDFRRIHSGDVKIYERLGAPGRTWLVHGVTPVPGEVEAQAALQEPAFDPRASAVVEQPLPAAAGAAAEPGEGVVTLRYTNEAAAYSVEVATPGLLVIADAWYPGWRATVDGQPAPILRANLLYRAIALEPGSHEVVLTYQPDSWRTGVWISLVTGLVLLAALVVRFTVGRFIRIPAFLL